MRVYFAAVLVKVQVFKPLLVTLSNIPFYGIGNLSVRPQPTYIIIT